ncbi:MAG: stage II sporulation protein P [Lachnospiraceae bacterium]|nr:stage II sporulation protein P [Lachnospiraceae bacterium]
MASAAGQKILQDVWERFYPAPAMEGTGRVQTAGEVDPSYRAAKDVEAFFQEHSYLALYGNEETGGPGGADLWQPGLELAGNGAGDVSGSAGGSVAAGGDGASKAGPTGDGQQYGSASAGGDGAAAGGGAAGVPEAAEGAGNGVLGAGGQPGDMAGAGEGESSQAVLQDKVLAQKTAFPGRTYQLAQMEDYDFLMSHFYSVHTSTTASRELMDAKKLLRYDLRLDEVAVRPEVDGQPRAGGPQILIYHTHSQEAFADSGEGETIVGAGSYLAQLLEAKGFTVYHDRSVYDVKDGELDRNKAYTYALEGIGKILEENPSIQVVIDLHRDGVRSETHLVTEVGGKPTAQIMFFNGLSQTPDGPIPYLENPYREENLAFSLQLQLKAEAYFPGFARKIYLKGLRYNQHLRPRSCLVEAGAQTNTYEEVLNAMEPLAEVFTMVLRGK